MHKCHMTQIIQSKWAAKLWFQVQGMKGPIDRWPGETRISWVEILVAHVQDSSAKQGSLEKREIK